MTGSLEAERLTHTELEKSLTEGHNSTLPMVVRWLEERFKQSCASNTDFYLSFMLQRFEKGQCTISTGQGCCWKCCFKIKIQRCTMFLLTKIACIWTIFRITFKSLFSWSHFSHWTHFVRPMVSTACKEILHGIVCSFSCTYWLVINKSAHLIRISPLLLSVNSARGYFTQIQIILISSGLLDRYVTLEHVSCDRVLSLFCMLGQHIITHVTVDKILVQYTTYYYGNFRNSERCRNQRLCTSCTRHAC